MACLTMIAFAIEANVNFIGSEVMNPWDEALPTKEKIKMISQKLGFAADFGKRPYQTVTELKQFRDALAHGKPIERLMRENGLRARPRRRGLPKDTGERSAASDNLLDRAFEAAAPNQKWIADFTYIWTAEGWLYVAAVVDLFSRRVVGWAVRAEMTAQLVTDALIMAIWRRGKPDSLPHHSDQGSQYTSEQFQRLMADHGITCSMSRSGNVWDNAAMESFFSSLKTERTARKVYRTRDDARADVFDYIERFYNPRRRHSTLGYLSPVEFEEQAMLVS
jgi:putative transposase